MVSSEISCRDERRSKNQPEQCQSERDRGLQRQILTPANVLRELARVVVEAAREPEVADRQVAVRVHEEVRRLEVAVEHVRAVDVLERAQDLV